MAYTREQRNEYMRKRYHRKRKEWIDSQGGKCKTCGSVEKLEIDHIDPETKELSVGQLWSLAESKRLPELLKCQVLCYTCHKLKTRVSVEVQHGGGVSGKHGCKCDPCRLRKNEYLKNLKRERRARGLMD